MLLSTEIEHLGSTSVQDRLWDELLDRDVQKQLEEDAPIINWSLELTERLGSRLYALWNRTAGIYTVFEECFVIFWCLQQAIIFCA
jgi:ubiquitin thioesterase ZRANB1